MIAKVVGFKKQVIYADIYICLIVALAAVEDVALHVARVSISITVQLKLR